MEPATERQRARIRQLAEEISQVTQARPDGNGETAEQVLGRLPWVNLEGPMDRFTAGRAIAILERWLRREVETNKRQGWPLPWNCEE